MNRSLQMFSRDDFAYAQAPGFNMPNAHYHGWYEIYYLAKGTRRHFIETSIYDIQEGDIILIPEMTVHQTMRVPGSDAGEQHVRYLLSPYKADIPPVFLPLFDKHHYRLPKPLQKRIQQCFEDLNEAPQKHGQYYSYYINANLIKILSLLAMADAQQPAVTLSALDSRMHKAAEYVKEHCCEQLTLAAVAKEFGYTKEYFSSAFKRSTGFGFSEYLNHMRISKAVHLLQTTDWSVTKLAALCGFNDGSYFASVFRRSTGLSPQKFRLMQESLASE
ncbi:MAG: helix-turn-helix transcriptional regulator [Clostridia bacterium]|nr:helix-turn-helix transcriptional regulator [Clostridia bacterium]